MSSEKMKYINSEMSRVMMLAVLCAILVMAIVTRSLRGIVSPILSAFAGILMTFGLVGYLGFYECDGSSIPRICGFDCL